MSTIDSYTDKQLLRLSQHHLSQHIDCVREGKSIVINGDGQWCQCETGKYTVHYFDTSNTTKCGLTTRMVVKRGEMLATDSDDIREDEVACKVCSGDSIVKEWREDNKPPIFRRDNPRHLKKGNKPRNARLSVEQLRDRMNSRKSNARVINFNKHGKKGEESD